MHNLILLKERPYFFSTLGIVSSIVPAGRQNSVLGNGPCDVINGDVMN